MSGARADAELLGVARRQHGMVTVAQMKAAGFSSSAIGRRAESGWFLRRHLGVYQVGLFPGPFGREMAAVLAAGPTAVISHRSAGWMWELPIRWSGPVELSLPGALTGRRPGVRAHRAVALPEADVTLRGGLRLTTVPRTLLDLAAATPARELERLVEDAQVRGLTRRHDLLAVLERAGGRRGVRALRSVVGPAHEPAFTRSEAERRLLTLVRKAGLPVPSTNVRVAGWEVDALWRAQRLIVEVDGFAYHGTREAFERDRRRDARLLIAGYRVVRITWRQLTREPDQVVALLAAALVVA